MAQGRDTNGAGHASLKLAAANAARRIAGLLRRSRMAGAASENANLTYAVTSPGRSAPRVSFGEEPEAAPPGLSRADSLTLSLSRRLFLVKELVLPASESGEIESMIAFELTGLFPIEPEKLTWHWHAVEVTAEGYTRVRVVAAETQALEQHLDSLPPLQHTAISAEPATISLANLLCAQNGGWPREPAAVVAVWAGGMDFAVVGPRGVEFDRGTPLDPEALAENVSAGVADSLAMAGESLPDRPVSRVILWADTDASQILESIADRTGLPVEAGRVPDFADSGGDNRVREAIAIGASLGAMLAEGIRLALVPPMRKAAEETRARAGSALLTAALVILALAFAWGALNLRARRLARYVERLEARAGEIAPEASQIDAKRQRLAAIKRQLTGRNRILEILVELYRITPPDISLTTLELDKNGLLTLKGHAQEMYRASEYAQILEKSDLFGEPAQQGPASFQRTEGGKKFISFTIMRNLSEAD